MVVGLLLAAAVAWQSTHASLSDAVDSRDNTWAAGAVTLTDDRNGVAIFAGSDTGLAPGVGPPRCIEVTYSGDAAAEVRLYLTALDNHGREMDRLMRMKIELGSGSSCTSPGSWQQVGDATLRATAEAASSWTTGMTAGSWSPTGSLAQTRPYRFTPTVADDDKAQGAQVGVRFVWEARST